MAFIIGTLCLAYAGAVLLLYGGKPPEGFV